MKVSDLLEKLEMPLNLLRLVGKHLNVEIKNKDQILDFQETDRFQRLVLQDNFSELVTQIKTAYNATIREAYSDDKNHYFNGHIKWFSDPERIKDYGFATIENVGDVYFQRRDIYQSDSDFLNPGSIVLIRIPNDNVSLEHRKKAYRINLLTDEENISFLAYLKIHKQIPHGYEESFKTMLTDRLVNLNMNNKRLLSLFLDTIPAEKFDPNQLEFYTDLYKISDKKIIESSMFHNLNNEQKLEIWLRDPNLIPFDDIINQLKVRLSSKKELIDSLLLLDTGQKEIFFETVLSELKDGKGSTEEFMTLFINAPKYEVCLSYETLSEEIVFKLWETKSHEIPVASVKRDLAKILSNDKLSIPKVFLEEAKEDQQKIFEFALEELSSVQKLRELTFMPNYLTLFKRANDLDIILSVDTINPLITHTLWRHKLVKKAVVSEIYKDYLKIFNSLIENKDAKIPEVIKKEYPEDIQRLDDDEVSNLLAVHFYDLDNLSQKDYEFFKMFLEFNLSEEQIEKLISLVKTKVDGYGNLRLFVDNQVQSIDYDDAVLYTALLNSEDQKLFFKKCLSLVENGNAEWGLSDFKRIVSIDYELYAQSKSIGNFKLDFSLAMILHIADQIANGHKVNQESIFGIVANVINDPKELLEITGFFDKCHDRQSIKEIQNTDPKVYELIHYKDSNPRFATYCEGRKAMINKETPATCDRSGKEFHWCENVKCYQIARRSHSYEDWRNYSLADVLRILNIEFSEVHYEQLIGTINKANRFFEHLTCRKCDHILHPSGKDNYGFYRVSNFCCKNPDCIEDENNKIYLSHCANGTCLDIVDSRDTVRCKTEGNGDNCGWYVCNNCHSCCTSKNIKGRAFILEKMGQQYNCHKEGHWDRNKLCCNKCGTEMNESGSNYDEVLHWFLDNKESHPNISNSGINQYERNWFIWRQGNFSHEQYRKSVVNLRRSGFSIPDYEDEHRTSYLVAEPRKRPNTLSRNLKCPECKNELIIREDTLPADQYHAIKKYHFDRA